MWIVLLAAIGYVAYSMRSSMMSNLNGLRLRQFLNKFKIKDLLTNIKDSLMNGKDSLKKSPRVTLGFVAACHLIAVLFSVVYFASGLVSGRGLALLFAAVGSAVTVLSNYGVPPFKVPNGAKMWAAKVLQNSPDVPCLMYVVIVSSSSGGPSLEVRGVSDGLRFLVLALPMLVIARRSLSCVLSAVKQFELLPAGIISTLKPYEERALGLSVKAEVAVWPLQVVLLLTRHRDFLGAFMYLNYLRLRYMSPRSAASHREAWKGMGSALKPVLQLPAVASVVDRGVRWFSSS